MTEFVHASDPGARSRVLTRVFCFAGSLLFAIASASAEPPSDATKSDDTPAIQKSTAPGVGEIVEVPQRMHHTLHATVDAEGKVEIQGRRGAPAARSESDSGPN